MFQDRHRSPSPQENICLHSSLSCPFSEGEAHMYYLLSKL